MRMMTHVVALGAVVAGAAGVWAAAGPGHGAHGAGAPARLAFSVNGGGGAGAAPSGFIHEKLHWQSSSPQGNGLMQDQGECETWTTFPTYTTQQARQLYWDVQQADYDSYGKGQPMHTRSVTFKYSAGEKGSYGLDQSNHMWAAVQRIPNAYAVAPLAPSGLQLRPAANSFSWFWNKPYVKVIAQTIETNTYADGTYDQRQTPAVWLDANCGVQIGTPQAPVRQPMGQAGPQPVSTPLNVRRDGSYDGQAWADWDLRALFAVAAHP